MKKKSQWYSLVAFSIIVMPVLFPAPTSGWSTYGPTWGGDDTTMSLNLGSTTWNDSAEDALARWNLVVGTSFSFYYNNEDHDRCDRGWACLSTDGNAVEWEDFSNGVCDDPASGALAVTRLNWISDFCNADVLFNNQYTWTNDDPGWTTGSPYNFNSVAIHEFGHVVGLDHEDRWLATMNSKYHPFPHKIHADDMGGIRYLYSSSSTVTDLGVTNWKKTDGNVATAAQLVSSPTAANSGQTISMEVTVENYSTATVTFNNRLYLSTNNIISSSDTPIGTYNGAYLSAGWLATWSYSVTIPFSTPSGTYWLGICVDYDSAVSESNEGNNCLAHPRTITITCPTPATPSLVTPASGATGVSTTPLLDWSDVSGATSYDVQVCSNSGCATVVRSANPGSSQWTVSPALSTGGTYWWRARAKNACAIGSWSGIRSLTTLGNTPLNDTTEFVKQQYRDFLNREGDSGGVQFWKNQIDSGAMAKAQVIDSFFWSAEFAQRIAPIVRLYFAYFLRIPDYGGLMYWIGQYTGGMPLGAISGFFAGSLEFQQRYGNLSNEQFVNLIYQNILGRLPDPGGYAFWIGQLNYGAMTRGQVMVGFSESAEYRTMIGNEVYVTMMYIGMLRRSPDQGGFNFWVNYLDTGNSRLVLINEFLYSVEYANRF